MSLRIKANWQRAQLNLQIDTNIPTSGITAIFGRSGCGKTSLLRLIAGIERVKNAEVLFNQQPWQIDSKFVPIERRRIGLVLQQPSLLPHLSVEDNLLYGYKRTPLAERRVHPELIINLLSLSHFLGSDVSTLSGGQQQRVALGRALLTSPQLLLLDEPFSGLDNQSKAEILPFVREVVERTNIPVLLVTHDTREVEKLADHVVFMENGRLAPPQTIADALHQPFSPLFIGSECASIFVGILQQTDDFGRQKVSSTKNDGCYLWLSQIPTAAVYNTKHGFESRVRILAKDVGIALAPIPDISIQNQLSATITDINHNENYVLLTLKLEDGQILHSEITAYSYSKLELTFGIKIVAMIKSLALD